MDAVQVWVSNFGEIDISKFSHLKFRKDGGLDKRREKEYYRDLNDHIATYEKYFSERCQDAWEKAGKMPNA